eukprot:m.3849 g.3849  ORF g.3849 m.3849 type:complete len:309 (+) comp2841_c0_seq1:185-1111(+)
MLRRAFSPTTATNLPKSTKQQKHAVATTSNASRSKEGKPRKSKLTRRNQDMHQDSNYDQENNENIPITSGGFSSDVFNPQARLKEKDQGAQFNEELSCMYCGSAHITSIKKGLTPTQRRDLATRAVTEITKLKIRHRDMKLNITDKGMKGLCKTKESSMREVFHENVSQIQYLLAGRRQASSGGRPPNTYVLLFATGSEERNFSVCHLLKFASQENVTSLYNATHRMLRDSMFSSLFDIENENRQAGFDPKQIQRDMEKVEQQISNLLLNDITKTERKISNVQEAPLHKSIDFSSGMGDLDEYLDMDC